MEANVLSKAQRSLLQSLYTRHGRKKSDCCVCEGLRAVTELTAARPDLIEFSLRTRETRDQAPSGAPCYVLEESEFDKLAGTVRSQGVLAVARVPEPLGHEEAAEDPFVLALDRVGDPGNFGTICRTARAAGLHELWLTAGSVDPFGDKAIRSALGAQFAMKLRYFADLAEMRSVGEKLGLGKVYLTDPHEGESCFKCPGLFDRTILVIGCESTGVGELRGAGRAMIPMPGGFESLNAAQAATIFLFEHVRRTQK